jgi:hypothetical protein
MPSVDEAAHTDDNGQVLPTWTHVSAMEPNEAQVAKALRELAAAYRRIPSTAWNSCERHLTVSTRRCLQAPAMETYW